MKAPPIYGLMAEFDSPADVVAAAGRASAAGYTLLDAYSPFPVEGLDSALRVRHTRLPLLVLIGGIIGCAGGFFMQYYAAVIAYPLNVGGRPLDSWPSFIPITFELTVLCAGLTAVIGMLALNGLPRPYHPVFNVPSFERATLDGFFLCIEAADPLFGDRETREFLETLRPKGVHVVPH
ncbi:MAG TPA: DUF3341 domain-containing protein [Bacteroidota bacterium]|nr:DUF3341 domain-containing protein [Bacteroidota bacterium]